MKLFVLLTLAGISLLAQPPQPRRIMRTDGSMAPTQPGAFTQPYPQPSAQPEYIGPKGSISGTVTDSVSGTPIKKAQVRVSGLTAVTDASGAFTFEQLPPGDYAVTAAHPAYPPGLATVQSAQNLTAGEQKRGVELKLTPGVTVSGRITDDDGDALANCNVTLFSQSWDKKIQTVHTAATNAAGDYAIPMSPAGKYFLQARCSPPYVQPRAFAPPDAVPAGPQLGYAARFYPGTSSFTGAQKVKLIAGQQASGFDFRMPLQSVSTVTVHVSGLEEDRRTRLSVNLTPSDAPAAGMGFTGLTGAVQPRTGTAQIRNVPPGTYSLKINSNGPERTALARETLQVAEEPRELSIQLQPGSKISGILHRPAATAPPGSGNTLRTYGGLSRISLAMVDDQDTQISAAVAEDGTFTLNSVGPGRYKVIPGQGFVESVSMGGELTEGPEFVVKEGAAGPLIVNIGSEMGTLSGEVQVGDSHPAQVFVFANSGTGAFTTLLSNGASGQPLKYSLIIPPGTYRVFALEVANPNLIAPLMASDALQGRGETVDMRPSTPTTRNLKLVTAADFEKADQ